MRLRRPALVDALLALALTALTVAALAPDLGRGSDWAALGLGLLASAPVAFRQRAPVAVLLVIAAALAAYALLDFGEWPSGGLGLVVAVFTVATLRPPRVMAAVMPVVVADVALLKVTTPDVTWPLMLQALLVCGCAWAIGDGTRRWAARAQGAAADAARLVGEERIRIARELHDVVAHHMAVVALQTGVASYVLESDAPAARRALDDASAAGREALRELARMLDALRTKDADPASYGPQPGLAQLDELVGRMRSVGLAVTLERSGALDPPDAGLELCAFRVVQESLTNVLKHAGPGATAVVRVAAANDVLTVDVSDDGGAARAQRSGAPGAPGRGLDGMRERAALYGGELSAGPLPGGGFRVRLEVPR